MLRDPAFLVVGTPRSGTTLVQRLACELSAVRMPPETHFFSLYAPEVLRRTRFPLQGTALRDEVQAWAANDGLGGLPVDVDATVDRLQGRAESLWDLFAAIVRQLSGEAEVYGEKTPTHLLWWPPLARRLPRLKFIAVVRDPRAVVASGVGVPFGMRGHVLQAERWAADQRLLLRARSELAPDRLLVLRYEDVVANPDGAGSQIASFLGVERTREPVENGGGGLYQPWESWKEGVSGPINIRRADAWRTELDERTSADVAAICRREMPGFGYLDGLPSTPAAFTRLSRLSPVTQVRRLRFRNSRRRLESWLDSDQVAGALRPVRTDRVSKIA